MMILKDGRDEILLDVGCSGLLLSHELIVRRFLIIDLDIDEYILRNYREIFIKSNILNN